MVAEEYSVVSGFADFCFPGSRLLALLFHGSSLRVARGYIPVVVLWISDAGGVGGRWALRCSWSVQ